MKRIITLACVLAACGQPQGGSITLNFPADLITNGILHAAVFESGSCATLSDPVNLNDALVRVSDPANFDAQNEHPMTLSAIPVGTNRMVVAVVERDESQICRACTDGLVIKDATTSNVRLILEGCP